MKKASKVLFIIGGIFAILGFIAYLGLSIGSFVVVGFTQAINSGKSLEPDILDVFNKMCAELGVNMVQLEALFMTYGIVFAILFVFNIASTVFSFIDKTKDNPGLGLLIPSVIIHIGACNFVSFVGGVLAIIYWAVYGRKENKPQEEQKA